MLVLYGNYISGHTQTVLTCAAEMGLLDSSDFKLELTDFSTSKSDDYKDQHHPFGQLPYLVDTAAGMEVFEARAIAKYLALKTRSKLYPQAADDMVAWKNFEQASSFEMADFDWASINFTWKRDFEPMFTKQAPNMDVINAFKEALEERLPGYERILSKQKFLAGDNLTLVDLFHLAHGNLLVKGGGLPSFDDGTYPNIKLWWDRLTSLESWKRVQRDAGNNKQAHA